MQYDRQEAAQARVRARPKPLPRPTCVLPACAALVLALSSCEVGSVPVGQTPNDAGEADAGSTPPDAAAADHRSQDLRQDSALDATVEDSSRPDAAPSCPVEPCQIIDSLPYEYSDDTTTSSSSALSSYSCASDVGEGGPEQFYQLTLAQSGTLIVMLDDGRAAGADIDIHLLTQTSQDSCLDRGHVGLSEHLEAGTYYLVADTWSNTQGQAFPGPYTIYVHFIADSSNCGMLADDLPRIGVPVDLAMPTTGKVVKEAHLVTDQEFTGGDWPASFTQGLAQHYALTESVVGYSMNRTEPWCPCCEPSNAYGQGSSVRPPVEAEAFYINMRWAEAPERGQRYIVFNGLTGDAVVAAAGYENGPGDTSNIGGACEEIHHHLQTSHLSILTFGVARDQTLSYGPVVCQ